MKHVSKISLALGIATALGAASLTGCGGASAPPLSAVRSLEPSRGSTGLMRRARSWMQPEAKSQPLLYVSNSSQIIDAGVNPNVDSGSGSSGTGEVDVYTFKASKNARKGSASKLVGQLTDFSAPAGECVDTSGNVFIADYYAYHVVEYAHGGTAPINTFAVTGYPLGCSVDPNSGNLAVSVFAYDGNQGAIEVFSAGSSQPAAYEPPNITVPFPPGYDSNGNLFFEGKDAAGNTWLDELSGGSFSTLSFNNYFLHYPGNVQWDGKYLAATDMSYNGKMTPAILRLVVFGSNAFVISTTIVADNCGGYGSWAIEPWIVGKTALGGNIDCPKRFDFWSYPAGGQPASTLSAPLTYPYVGGETVSNVKK